jgi:hypothetical protein
MRKVIYISYEPLTNSIYNHFYINVLKSENIVVEYWDLSSLFFETSIFKSNLNSNIIIKIMSRDDLKEQVRNNQDEDAIFITLMTYEWSNIWLFRILKRYKCYCAFFNRPGLPAPKSVKKQNIVSYLDKNTINRIIAGLTNKLAIILKKVGYVNDPDIMFSSGSHAIENSKNIRNIIQVNHFDYDNAMLLNRSNDRERNKNKKYIIFLDENTPYHPDFKMLGMNIIDSKEYFDGLNRFFDLVEKKWDKRILIAAHPSSNYKNDEFDKREIIKYRTSELVKDCHFTLAHGSTSISFPVLYSKPIMFLYNNQFKAFYSFSTLRWIFNLSNILGGSIYNVDAVTQSSELYLNDIDVLAYKKYKYSYLTNLMTENKLSSDLFINYLKSSGSKL